VRARHRVAIAVSLAVLSIGALALGGPVAGASRDRLRVNVWVLDFDPLIDGVPLTTSRAWSDPLALDPVYATDVAAVSKGIAGQRIVRTTTIRDYPVKPGGFQFTNAFYLGCLADSSPTQCSAKIDYAAVLNTTFDSQLGTPCEAVRRGRVDEIWLWGGPWFGYWEYQIVDPNTFCAGNSRTFVVMGFSYERAESDMLHDLGHRAEALIRAGIGTSLWDRCDGQWYRYSQDFACPDQPDATHPEVPPGVTHVGNVHFPPNAYCHYQFDRQHPVVSDADDWVNFPALTGATTVVDASTWGGTQQTYTLWWLGHLPRNRGTFNGVSTDWWTYVFPAHRGRS
jgi:hypothetical protein